jgi:hypothetical protein
VLRWVRREPQTSAMNQLKVAGFDRLLTRLANRLIKTDVYEAILGGLYHQPLSSTNESCVCIQTKRSIANKAR